MEGLTPLESAVLEKLLSGEQPTLATLRAQLIDARLVRREVSGVGFFCMFEVSTEAPRLQAPGDFQIDDVCAEVAGLKHGAGFVLFVREGCLDMLEGFSYDEPWPREQRSFTLSYQREPRAPLYPSPSAT